MEPAAAGEGETRKSTYDRTVASAPHRPPRTAPHPFKPPTSARPHEAEAVSPDDLDDKQQSAGAGPVVMSGER